MIGYIRILKTVLILVLTTSGVAQEKALSDVEVDKIVSATIDAHGGSLYDTASYSFVFREKTYSFTNTANGYQYSVVSVKKDTEILDILENGTFKRLVDKKEVSLTQKEQNNYSEALNSVLYFATLPHKLKDKAVIKKHLGTTRIKNVKYHIVSITFTQEGGGKDYDDAFHYWINEETNKIDYLAYKYHVNGGGVRFRSAYNSRVVDGITFQDYINYKATIGTPLIELPLLFEKGKLKELSKIITENIINLNTKK